MKNRDGVHAEFVDFARVIDVVARAFWLREMPLNFPEAPGTIGK
jgi:hypothetical protein